MEYLFLCIGLVLLLVGAEFLIRAAVAIAEKLGIPLLIVGLTVVAFGTSAPELLVSINAALSDSPGIAMGNIVGSNISNILFILGITALIRPIEYRRGDFFRDYFILFFVTAIFSFMILSKEISMWEGGILLTLLIAFIAYNYTNGKNYTKTGVSEIKEEVKELGALQKKSWILLIFLTILGCVGLAYGADLLVKNAVIIAKNFGVSDEVIGLTLIAIGTSLPELAAGVIAAIRRQNEVVLGNIIGSNIWNVLLIIGTTATIKTIPMPRQIISFDLWAMVFATCLLFLFIYTERKFKRSESVVFLILYVGYIAMQYWLNKGYLMMG